MALADALVYVVDDDASVRRSLERVICSAGLEACGFGSAQEFLEAPRRPVASCLVLDYQMPDLDGLGLQATLVGHEKEMPVIFLTGRGTIPLCVSAMQGGAVDFLTKPVDPARLLGAIEIAIDLDRIRLEQVERRRPAREAYQRLTAREQEVFRLVARGRLNKQIGYALGVTEKTIKVHRAQRSPPIRPVSRASWTVDRNRSASKGLWSRIRPRASAAWRVGASSCAVIRMTGSRGWRPLSFASRSSPLMRGRWMSSTRHAGRQTSTLASNSSAEVKLSTAMPAEPRRRLSARRTDSSSSMT